MGNGSSIGPVDERTRGVLLVHECGDFIHEGRWNDPFNWSARRSLRRRLCLGFSWRVISQCDWYRTLAKLGFNFDVGVLSVNRRLADRLNVRPGILQSRPRDWARLLLESTEMKFEGSGRVQSDAVTPTFADDLSRHQEASVQDRQFSAQGARFRVVTRQPRLLVDESRRPYR